MGYRYYDPGTGRFLTRDPIGYAGGANLYAYVDGDPVNWADPWGLDKIVVWIDKDKNHQRVGSHARLFIGNDQGRGQWYGFYPKHGKKGRCPSDDGKVHPYDAPSPCQSGVYVTLDVSREERKKMQRQVINDIISPPDYDLSRFNCSTWVQHVVGAGGIGDDDPVHTPDQLINGLGNDDHYDGRGER